MLCIIYNKCIPKMSVTFNLQYYNGLLLNLVSDAALGLSLEAGSKTCKIHIRMLRHMVHIASQLNAHVISRDHYHILHATY